MPGGPFFNPGNWSGVGNRPRRKSDRQASADLRRERQDDQSKKLRLRASRKDLAKGLPPIQSTAPSVMPTGTGIANISAIAAASGGIPGNKGVRRARAGAGVPSVDTSLNVNDKGILKRARNAAQIEYNPQIDAVRNLIQSTQSGVNRDIKDVQNAYGAVGGQIQAEIPQIGQNYDTQQARIAALYQQLGQGIDQRYNDTAASNAKAFEALGIQAAAPQVNQRQTADRDFLSQLAALQGQGVNDVLEVQQQGAQNLARNTGYRAGLEGANQSTNLQAQLADKLLELRSQKGSLIGNRAKSVRELADQYRTEAVSQAERDRAFGLDAAQFQESVRQNNIANAMDDRNFKQGVEMDRAKLVADTYGQQQKQSQVDLRSLDPQERAAYKADQLVPGSGDRMFAYLQNLVNSDPNIRRGFYVKQTPDGRTQQVRITPQQFGYLARKHAKLTGLPAGSVQKIAEAYWNEQ